MAYQSKSGKYVAVIRINGRRTTRTCPTKRDALDLERQSKHDHWQVKNGLRSSADILIESKGAQGVEEALEEHLRELADRGRTRAHRRNREWAVKRVLDGTGVTSCSSLHSEEICRYIDEISRGRSARTYNNNFHQMKSFCEWLVSNRFIRENPVQHLRPRSETQSVNPSRVMTIDEVDRLFAHAGGRLAFYTFVLFTGFRWGARYDGGEAIRLRWEWIDLKHCELVIPTEARHVTKNRRKVRVPLAPTIVECLTGQMRIGGPLFRNAPTLKTWQRDLKAAGITYKTADGTLHRKSTRKTFATRLAEAGVVNEIRGRLMRHRDTMLVERTYTEKTDAMIRDERKALQRMERFIEKQRKSKTG